MLSPFADRNNEIKKLRKDGWKLKAIGSKFKISQERVRQIVSGKATWQVNGSKLCPIHNRPFREECFHCKIERLYKERLRLADGLEEEIKRLAKHDRRHEVVIQRRLLIKKLKERGANASQIAKVLNLDHSSILYHLEH